MLPDFLPPQAAQLTEPASIAMAQGIRREPVTTPLLVQPIPTSLVQGGQGGAPLLLLHGFDSSLLEFRRLFPLLAKQRATWAVDMLGFGFTERLPGIAYSPEAIRAHLYGFWRQFLGVPMVLVGTSMGGGSALDFALNHPECVERLVLIDSVGLTSGVPPVVKYLFPPLDYLAVSILRDPRLRQSVSRQSYVDSRLATADATCCGALPLAMPGWYQANMAFLKSGGYPSFRDCLSRLTIPTLILWGEQDRILDPKFAQVFKAQIKDSRLVWIPQAGHVPHLEQPALTAGEILQFAQ